MTDWVEFLAQVRADLQDTSATPKWSDSLLYMYTCDAIRDYSLYFPKRIDQLTLHPGSTNYTLPTDLIEIIAVEVPANRYLYPRQATPGRMYPQQSRSTQYFTDGGNLYLNGPLEDPLLLTYSAIHDMPVQELPLGETELPDLTVPDRDLELLRLYVRAEVYTQMRSKTSRLDRFEQGAGRRDDNPLSPETSALWDDYYRKLYARLPGGAVRLFRVGRGR